MNTKKVYVVTNWDKDVIGVYADENDAYDVAADLERINSDDYFVEGYEVK